VLPTTSSTAIRRAKNDCSFRAVRWSKMPRDQSAPFEPPRACSSMSVVVEYCSAGRQSRPTVFAHSARGCRRELLRASSEPGTQIRTVSIRSAPSNSSVCCASSLKLHLKHRRRERILTLCRRSKNDRLAFFGSCTQTLDIGGEFNTQACRPSFWRFTRRSSNFFCRVPQNRARPGCAKSHKYRVARLPFPLSSALFDADASPSRSQLARIPRAAPISFGRVGSRQALRNGAIGHVAMARPYRWCLGHRTGRNRVPCDLAWCRQILSIQHRKE